MKVVSTQNSSEMTHYTCPTGLVLYIDLLKLYKLYFSPTHWPIMHVITKVKAQISRSFNKVIGCGIEGPYSFPGNSIFLKIVLSLRLLVSDFPPRRPVFDPSSSFVGFVVDKDTGGRFSPSSSAALITYNCVMTAINLTLTRPFYIEKRQANLRL
jgi:hypothetical protein